MCLTISGGVFGLEDPKSGSTPIGFRKEILTAGGDWWRVLASEVEWIPGSIFHT